MFGSLTQAIQGLKNQKHIHQIFQAHLISTLLHRMQAYHITFGID